MPLPMLAGAAIQAIPAITGLFGNLFDKKRRNNQENFAASGIKDLTQIFKAQLGQNYFDSAEAQGAMKEIDQNSNEFMDEINATASMSGMTDEAKIALMGQNMRAKQGAYSGLAKNADLFRQRALQNYQGSLSRLFQVGATNRANSQNSINNIVGGMSSGIDGAVNAGVFDSWLGK